MWPWNMVLRDNVEVFRVATATGAAAQKLA